MGPYYKPPARYVTQLLMEMHSTKTKTALLVCWLPTTTTVLEVSFSESMWTKIWDICIDIYGDISPKRPTRLHPKIKELKKDIASFVETNSKIICEVDSVKGKPCLHDEVDINSVDDLYLTHASEVRDLNVTPKETVETAFYQYDKCITDAYSLTRDIAKQVLVVMLSDFDRSFKLEFPHSCPVAYGLTNYSFTSQQASDVLKEVRRQCQENGVRVVAHCYDGAFAKLAVRGDNNEPLTLLQLSKDVWSEACSMSKQEIVKAISSTGKIENVHSYDDLIRQTQVEYEQQCTQNGNVTKTTIGHRKEIKLYTTPMNWKTLLYNKESIIPNASENTNLVDIVTTVMIQSQQTNDNDINNVTSLLPDENETSNVNISEKDQEEDSLQDESRNFTFRHFDDYDIHTMWLNLKETDKKKQCTKEEFVELISTADSLSKLTKHEIVSFCKPVKEKLKQLGIRSFSNMKKGELINRFCEIFSDGSTVQFKQQLYQPKSLSFLAKSYVQTKLSKGFLNAVQASYIYSSRLETWRSGAPFKDNCKVNDTSNPPFWYCQLKYLESESQYVFDFLDPEHLLTNTRSKVCSTGIPKADISRNAWIQTAKFGKENGSNLNLALVENLVDKQNVGFALKTFSLGVEEAMLDQEFVKEAHFYSLIRNWYSAQDERGIQSIVRHQYEQELRAWLLKDVRFDIFPPPGKYVKDIPIILYEGFMIHIDRRSQLYTFTGGKYNSRGIGTLDNENLFGAFQDWDSKGTGVLRADEVPQALHTACDLYSTRLNSDRGFFMHTSSSRVYPVPALVESDCNTSTTFDGVPSKDYLRNLQSITMKDHEFDNPAKRKPNPHRKKGTISGMNQPSKGIKGVRAEPKDTA